MKLIIKFISTIHHVGSNESTINQISGMSKAAGKFNFTIGASVKKHHSEKAKSIGSAKNSQSIVIEIDDCTPEDAAKIGTHIFNLLDRVENSDKYNAAKSKFDTAKRQVLANMAVSDYSELTKEQRIMYAKEMIKLDAPFHYTERSVHIKYGDHISIYSKTHRNYGIAYWTQEYADKCVTAARNAMKDYDVTLIQNEDEEPEDSTPGASNLFNQ